MNRTLFTLAAVAVLTGTAAAQDPYGDYNRARAYAHFANSTAAVKSFSSLDAARVTGYDTPFESARFYQSPGYYREVASARLGRSVYADPGTVSGVITTRYPYFGDAVRSYYDEGLSYPGMPSSGAPFALDADLRYPGMPGTDFRYAGYPRVPAGPLTAPAYVPPYTPALTTTPYGR